MIITYFQYALVAWGIINIFNFVMESLSFFGGDGIQPYDIMWWIRRPFSFRQMSLVSFPMLIGAAIWIVLIWGTGWAVTSLWF